jgi:predicted ATPase
VSTLLEACSALIHEVLARCPNINIVTTSREPLALPGELVYRVPCVELPTGNRDRCPGAIPAGSRTAVRRTRLAYRASFKLNTRPRIRGGDLSSS